MLTLLTGGQVNKYSDAARANWAAKSTTHGLSKTSTYRIWKDMYRRCNDPRRPEYKNYGGRGIKVCPEWASIDAFVADMGLHVAGMSLDRIDNNAGYGPDNCRWVDMVVQANNKRTNRVLDIDGVLKNMTQWSAVSGVKVCTILSRIKAGWCAKDAVFREPRNAHNN